MEKRGAHVCQNQMGICVIIPREKMTFLVAFMIATFFGLIIFLCMAKGHFISQKMRPVFWVEALLSFPIYFVINKYIIFLI